MAKGKKGAFSNAWFSNVVVYGLRSVSGLILLGGVILLFLGVKGWLANRGMQNYWGPTEGMKLALTELLVAAYLLVIGWLPLWLAQILNVQRERNVILRQSQIESARPASADQAEF